MNSQNAHTDSNGYFVRKNIYDTAKSTDIHLKVKIFSTPHKLYSLN